MKKALFTISVIALIALVGCKHDLQMAITELNGGSDTTIINPPPPVDTMICFESQILVIINWFVQKPPFYNPSICPNSISFNIILHFIS